MLVLYVDDEPALLEIGKLFLEQSGESSVDTVTSAPAALEILNKKNYDAIISDYLMPAMDGIEFLKKVRASGNTIPFIIFTGRGREEVVIQALNAGADFYLQKGGDPKALFVELEHMVRTAIRRHEAEKSLKESEARYRNVVEDQTELISRFRPDGKHVFVNEAYCRYFNKKRDEIIGKKFIPDLPGEDLTLVRRHFASLTREHPVATITQRIITPDGRIRWQQWSNRAIFDEEGHVTEYQSVGRDITNLKEAEGELLRKNEEINAAYEELTASEEELRQNYDELSKKEQALRESEEKFRTVVNHALDGILILDFKGTILFANRAAGRIIDAEDSPEMIGTRSVLEFIAPESMKDVLRDLGKVALGIDAYLVIYKVITTLQRQVWIECIGKKITFQGLPAILVSIRDITARKQEEERLSKTYQAFLKFGTNPVKNINIITALAGELLQGTCALYNRLKGDVLQSLGQWNTPADFIPSDHAEGHICFDIIRSGKDTPVIIEDLQSTKYAETDPNVKRYGLKAYIGKSVKIGEKSLGSLCVVYQKQFTPTPSDLEILGLLANAIGIEDERHEALMALEESEAKYRNIIENMQDAVYRTDRDGNLIMFSPRGVKAAGYDSEEEMIGLSVANDTYQNPKEREQFLAALTEKGFVENYPLVLKARDGTPRFVTASSHFYYDDQGNVLGVEGILHDITDLSKKEQELRDSEERYHALFHDNPTMLFTLDSEGMVISVNEFGASHLGYTAGELEGQSVLNIFSPDDHHAVTEQLQVCLQSPGEVFHWQFRKVRKDGSLIWVDEYARAMMSSRGELSVLVICQDITDWKRAEEALRQSEEKYRTILENIQDVYYRTDTEGNLILASPSAAKVLGYDPENSVSEFYGKSIAETIYYNPEERQKFLAELNKNGSVTEYEVMLKKRDGTPVLVSTSSHKYYDSSGKYQGVEGIFRDITDRKRTERDLLRKNEELNAAYEQLTAVEEELRTNYDTLLESQRKLEESEDRYRNLFDNANEAIFVIQDGRICFVNPRVEEISEYTKEELGSKPFLEFVHPDDRAMVGEQHMRRLAGEKLKDAYTFRILPKDGSVRWMEINANLIAWDRRPAVLVFLSDITERKQAEEALSQANKKLNLLSSITRHDILNQLTVLKGYLELSEEFVHDPAKVGEFIKEEIKAAKTIEDQIGFTRDYQNMGVNAPTWQNVNASISRAVAALPMRNIGVEVDRTDLEVLADPLLEKVFFNLVDNALKYGGDKITTIRFSSHESDPGMIIVCEDDGVGISRKEKKYLFERGFGKHTGFGLFLVREILSITGITIRETGEPGRGARFEIMVPKGTYRFSF